jgi:hypothetical protein
LLVGAGMSAFAPKRSFVPGQPNVRFAPCVDGSPFGKGFLDVLSFGRCGHVCGLFVRHTEAAGHNAFR